MVRAVTPIPFVKARFFDRCGKPLTGGQIYTYEANTTTPKVTYKDPYGLTPNTNPIILDAAGEADIYIDGTYRIRITDRNDVLVNDVAKIGSWFSDNLQDTLDNISGAMDDAIKPMLQNLDDVINTAAAAGAGANGWTDALIALPFGRSQRQKNSDIVSVKDFGAKGDGVTDDSDAFQAAANNGFALVPKGDYLITKTINITSKTVFLGVGGVVKPNYTGGIFNTKNGATLIVDNLLIDGSLYPFQWNAQHGMYVFTADNAEYISITNCKFSNVYGSGVRINSKSANIQGNILINVTGNNWTEDSSGAYDNYGDGIHVMVCNIALIAGNVVNNKLALESDNYLGRCGIVTEFDAKNVTILGNYVSGYDRGIHCETTYDNVIKNNNVENCGASLLLTHAWRSVVESNTFIATKKFTVGTFINYGVLCLYVDNYNSVVRDNKIIIADNSGHTSDFRAVWFSGNTEIKDYVFDSNLIIGGITANGGSNVLFKNNTFKPCSLKRAINFQGGFKFISNVFYGNLKLNSSVASSDMVIADNDFYKINDTNSVTLTNPSASGYKVNGNRFFIKEGATAKFVISAYMTGDTVGELSGNTIVLPSSADIAIRLLEYNNSSSLNKFYSVSPNLMLGGTKKVSVLFNSLSNDPASASTYDPPSLATNTQQSTTVFIPGAKVGYIVSVSFDKNLQGTRMWGEVTATDTVTVYHRNDTGITVDLPSGTLTVKIV